MKPENEIRRSIRVKGVLASLEAGGQLMWQPMDNGVRTCIPPVLRKLVLEGRRMRIPDETMREKIGRLPDEDRTREIFAQR